jgi:hypothetical protein
MATTAQLGSQAMLQVGDSASPPLFTTIYEVVSVGEIGQENDLIEATHLQSLAKEYIYGLADGIEMPIVVNYNPTNPTHIDMKEANTDRTTKHFKLVMPPGMGSKSFTFDAIVKGWRMPIAPNEIIQMTFNMKISGEIVGPI